MGYKDQYAGAGRHAGEPYTMSSTARRRWMGAGIVAALVIGLVALGFAVSGGGTNAHAKYFCTNSSFVGFNEAPTSSPGKVGRVAVEQFGQQVHVYLQFLFWQETPVDTDDDTEWNAPDYPSQAIIGIDVECIPPIHNTPCGPRSHPYVACPDYVDGSPASDTYTDGGSAVTFFDVGTQLTNAFGNTPEVTLLLVSSGDAVGQSTMFYDTTTNTTIFASPALTTSLSVDSYMGTLEPYYWNVHFTYRTSQNHLYWNPPSKCKIETAGVCDDVRHTL